MFGIAELFIFVVTTGAGYYFTAMLPFGSVMVNHFFSCFLAADLSYVVWKLYSKFTGGNTAIFWQDFIAMGLGGGIGCLLGAWVGDSLALTILGPVGGGIGAVLAFNQFVT